MQVQAAAGSVEEATRLADVLLDRHLAACVQVVGPVTSRYWWEGRVQTATEWLCLAKTTEARVDEAVAALIAAHSYDTPEVILLPVVGGNDRYLRWVEDTVHDRVVPDRAAPDDTGNGGDGGILGP